MKWRLIIDDKPRCASENMALDYALLKLCKIPTLRLYTWKPAAVSIGRFQSLNDEVNLEFCRENKIDFVRRITGGGAVFHENELTYSLTVKENNSFFSPDLHESYKSICSAVINGLSILGIKADYIPINDLLCNGKKISGCAQTRKDKTILQHGTLILEVDKEKMFKVLKVPLEKISDKNLQDIKDRVTSISAELKRKVSVKELADCIIKGFEKTFNLEFELNPVSAEETQLMKKIEQDIFKNPKWLFER